MEQKTMPKICIKIMKGGDSIFRTAVFHFPEEVKPHFKPIADLRNVLPGVIVRKTENGEKAKDHYGNPMYEVNADEKTGNAVEGLIWGTNGRLAKDIKILAGEDIEKIKLLEDIAKRLRESNRKDRNPIASEKFRDYTPIDEHKYHRAGLPL